MNKIATKPNQMKKSLLLIAYFLFSYILLAQDNPEPSFNLPRTLLKISPFQFALQTFELGIEKFNSNYSKSFNLSGGVRTGSDATDNGIGGNLELAYRKYPAPMKIRSRNNHDSYQGIYYSFFLRGEYFKGDDKYYFGNSSFSTDYTATSNSIAPGFTIGYQRTFWQIIILDAYIGGGVKFSKTEFDPGPPNNNYLYYTIFDPGYSGVIPKIGVKIGIGL